MFCDACGKQIPDDSNVCMFCGNKLGENPVSTPMLNQKTCPKCQSACFFDDCFCSECGYTFGSQPTQNENIKKSTAHKSKGAVKVFRVLAILSLCVYMLGCGGMGIIILISNRFVINIKNVWLLSAIIPSLLMIIGLAKRKNNIIPGIASLLFAFLDIFLVVFYYDEPLFYLMLVKSFAFMLLSVMFFVKKGFVKKLWFIPSMLVFIIFCSVAAIQLSYYNTSDSLIRIVILSLLPNMLIFLLPAAIAFFSGFASRKLWVTEDKSEETATL